MVPVGVVLSSCLSNFHGNSPPSPISLFLVSDYEPPLRCIGTLLLSQYACQFDTKIPMGLLVASRDRRLISDDIEALEVGGNGML